MFYEQPFMLVIFTASVIGSSEFLLSITSTTLFAKLRNDFEISLFDCKTAGLPASEASLTD